MRSLTVVGQTPEIHVPRSKVMRSWIPEEIVGFQYLCASQLSVVKLQTVDKLVQVAPSVCLSENTHSRQQR